ncbi:MAG: carboxymuconolactone decarboxylase family protein [Spirochaetales bacterium]|nr:carboxymuconolactone decarboxylase family protein [Spirochaetales bacterium]
MAERPLDIVNTLDKDLYDLIEKTRAMALYEDGALSKKMKLLIAVALDASRGAVGGVIVLAKQAMEAGATKEEIMEVLRITNFIFGVGSVYTCALALKELEKET